MSTVSRGAGEGSAGGGADAVAVPVSPVVTVAVLTFRRPDDLRSALPLLVRHVEAVPGAELLVVDNDVVPSARDVVEELGAGHPVRYAHEPSPGIAAARNRALDESAASDLVVFVDDDERPCEGWLSTLVAAHARFGGQGVVGPVVSEFDGPLDPWLEAGGFFVRLRHATGTTVRVAATNNLLLDAAFVRAHGLRFDEQFGLSGGSDTVFSLELARAGGRLVWCDEAVVVDAVPADRATRDWVLRRAFRMGNSGSRAAVHVHRSPVPRLRTRTVMAGRGAVRLVGGGVRHVVGRVGRRPGHEARGARTALRGAGMLLGAFGYTYAEYARTPETA